MHSYALKFIMLGDSRVGKSQLSRAFTNKPFLADAQTTVGMEFSTRTLEFEKCIIRAQLWDTAGQERFDSMTKAYYRDAVGVALIYDVTNKESFQHAKERWLQQVKTWGHESMKIILVGNKVDLLHEGSAEREVDQSEAIEFAKSQNIDYVETSGRTGFCVEVMFRRLIFSVAKLIPEVKNNLELTCLPDGWIIKLPSSESEEKRPRAASDDAATTMETATTVNSYVASKLSPASLDSRLTVMDRRKSTMIRLSYVNYWTGDVQSEIPHTPATTHLVHFHAPPPKKQKVVEDTENKENTNKSTGTIDLIEEEEQEQARKSLSSSSSGRKKLIREDSKQRESIEALTERSSSVKTIELSDSVKRRKVRTCRDSCIIL